MAIKKVTTDGLVFQCPVCGSQNEISFDAVVVRAGKEQLPVMILPPCECGARSMVAPSASDLSPRHHMRRIAWKRAMDVSKFLDDVSRHDAKELLGRIDAFYAQPGREVLRAQYEDPKFAIEVVTKKTE